MHTPFQDQTPPVQGDGLRTIPPNALAHLPDLLELMPDAILVADRHGAIRLANSLAEGLLQYSRFELIGRPIDSLLPDHLAQIHAAHREQYLQQPYVRLMSQQLSLIAVRKDGTAVPVAISLSPVQIGGDIFVLAAIRDATQLLKAIHHRVKNNLQVISSLLNLQADMAPDIITRMLLQESQARVRTLALVHEYIYQATDLAHIDLVEYTRRLLSDLAISYSASARSLLQVEMAPMLLDLETAIPCALILSELLANCFKHAFPTGRAHPELDEVRVTLSANDGRIVLSVADNGVGLPANFDPHYAPSLGMQLIHDLTYQLRGRMEIRRAAGAEFRLTFDASIYGARGQSSDGTVGDSDR
jgi:PAS domain S-box-containing protein